ncbi:MAG: hypothetical protein GQ564_23475 [Bacteroidales bacterium]|nr:hypothetical protein [Bacteroidales bacterium]
MKHITFCTECLEENPNSVILAEGEINSDLVAVCTCFKGHKSVLGLLHDLFDVLYFSAVDSFIKGCFSESVMSFAASLERTYEMFIKVTLLKDELSFDIIDNFWKELKNQSERQYGAFCMQYSRITGKTWRIDSNQVSFRNMVIHKGHIATSDEVRKYAEYTTSCQSKILQILQSDYEDECTRFYFNQKKLARPRINELMKKHNAKFAGMALPSLLNWNKLDKDGVTFSEALDNMYQIQKKFELITLANKK